MDGPFTVIRNKWQRTPLERIDDAICEVRNVLSKIESEKNVSEHKVQDLKITICTLKIERETRINKEKQLYKIRENLMKRVIHQREHRTC